MTPKDVRDIYSHVQFIFGHTAFQAKLSHVALVQFHEYGEEWSQNLKFALKSSCELLIHFLSDPDFRAADDRVDASIMASFAEAGNPSTDLMVAMHLVNDFISCAQTVQQMDGDNLLAAIANFEFVTDQIIKMSMVLIERLKTECGRIVRWVESQNGPLGGLIRGREQRSEEAQDRAAQIRSELLDIWKQHPQHSLTWVRKKLASAGEHSLATIKRASPGLTLSK